MAYIFMGDSFFALWGLPFNNMTNIAVNASNLTHQRAYIEKVYPIIHESLIMNVGTNDLGMNFSVSLSISRYSDLIDYLKTVFSDIYCVSVIPINKVKYKALKGETGHYLYNTQQRTQEINNGISNLCSEKVCTFIDTISSMSVDYDMKSAYTDDGIHPNSMGYGVMKSIFLEKCIGLS